MNHNEERDDHDDADILDVQATRQQDKIESARGAILFTFHINPGGDLKPFVSIWMGGKPHHRRPGAPSVGRALLADLNAVGAVRGGPGR